MKKLTVLILLLVLLFLLCACGHRHLWADATCTEPKTCSSCGVTEGAPLGHSWTEATCTLPKICSVCGAMQGSPLGHKATEPDYQHPGICSICGEVLSPALEPDFIKYGFDRFCELYNNYEYRTICDNGIDETTGRFRILSYRTRPSGIAGYEEKVVDVEIRFTDAISRKYGVTPLMVFDDYYDTRLMNDTCNVDEDGVVSWDIHWNGAIEKCYFYSEGHVDHLSDATTYTYIYRFQIPEGYDGVVIGATRPIGGLQDGDRRFNYFYDFCDEDSLFFRLT